MRVLVGCEFSGVVRDSFIRAGHDAWSCDLLPCENEGPHMQGDVRNVLSDFWDLMIAFPPCTHLCVSGARWFAGKRVEQACAVEFVRFLMDAPIERIAIENPVGVLSTFIRKPDQIIQPYQFGHGEVKKTCLWLKNLPPLMPANVDGDLFVPPTPPEREPRIWKMPPGPNRWKERSMTLEGVARAMSEQWGCK